MSMMRPRSFFMRERVRLMMYNLRALPSTVDTLEIEEVLKRLDKHVQEMEYYVLEQWREGVVQQDIAEIQTLLREKI